MRMLYNGTHAQLLYMQVCKESATYFNAIHRSLMLNGGSLNEMMSPPVEAAEFKLIIWKELLCFWDLSTHWARDTGPDPEGWLATPFFPSKIIVHLCCAICLY